MTAESPAPSLDRRLDEFYGDLEAAHLAPLWPISARLMPPTPEPRAIPYLWRWSTLRPLGELAGKLVSIDRGGDRRVLSLANPGLGGEPYATSTLWGAIQYLGPRESAPGHRHTPAAIRFVLEGTGVWTTVNGDACTMTPGDLVLTPSWHWHDHNNEGDQPMIWFDGLDLPTVKALDAVFFEPYEPDELQQVVGRDMSERLWGARSAAPRGDDRPAHGTASPLLVYRWNDIDAALDALHAERGGAETILEYTNPVTGGPVMPTLACEMHRLQAGQRTRGRRSVGSSIHVVYRGEGTSIIGGQQFRWGRGDIFVVPSWVPVEHEPDAMSDLFVLTDRPILETLHLFREEWLDTPQTVTGTFDSVAPVGSV